MPSSTEVDHVVINALFDLDAARDLFAALGFVVSPRGYHSLGSMNHLIMTEGPYLELVGVPREGLQRADVMNSPFGLSGLVFKSQDADTTYAALTDAGLPMLPPLDFSRPVDVGGASREARFRIVRSAPGCFAAGRIYFCQHLTPELVWNGEGLAHANGFKRLLSTRIQTTHMERDGQRYGAVTGTVGTAHGATQQFQLYDSTVELTPGEADQFASLELEFGDLEFLERAAAAVASVKWQRLSSQRGVLVIPSLSLRLECRAPEATGT